MIRQPIVTVCGHVDHGKCVSGDTIIPLADGTLITAKELFEKNFDKKKAKKEGTDIIQKTNEITLFSNYGSIILPKKASHIWKREKKELIEIKTAHGDIIKTTPEHPYFGFKQNEIKAEDLEVGDYITIPKTLKIKETNPKEILIKELKKSNFLCFLNLNSKKLVEKIRKEGINKIEKKLSIKHLSDSLRKARIRIKNLAKICEHFKISDIEFYSMIGSIKNSTEKQGAGHTSKLIKIPDLHEPEKLGYILGCIIGDGHLSETQVVLDNNDKDIQEKYSEYLKDIFEIDSSVKQNHTCQTVINKGGLTLKKFLTEIIGFPDKQKSGTIEVPKIAQVNKEIFKGFFAGLIDTDGYVSHINYSIELTSKSKLLIKQCSILLLNLGIQSVVYKKNGFHVLRIANKKYIDKFLENFKPRLKRKLIRIIKASQKAQSSRIFDILPISNEEIKKLKLPGKIDKSVPYFNKYLKNQNFTESFLKKVLENVKEENGEYHSIKRELESDTSYVKVVSKRKIKNKEKYVYDFTVPGTQNFVAERTIIHNTSILDSLRGSSVQEGEAGGITQKISFTSYPMDQLKKACPLIEKSKINLQIPGFLLIDTPGHAAFTNIRKRGGSLADLAVLVIDINDGIKPQTAEVIKILQLNKTPFLIALNKIDNITGWQTHKDRGLKESIEAQSTNVKQQFNEKYMTLIGSLNAFNLDADLYYNIEDFTQKIALVPTSAQTKQGIPELIMMLCGLSQKYLTKNLKLNKVAKGVALEIKKEKTTNYIEAILYDGELAKTDEIALSNFDNPDKPILSKIRILEKIEPLSHKFKPAQTVQASTGIRMQLTEKTDILPGMPFMLYQNNLEEIKEEFKKEISENVRTDKQGIIAKADSLGSLEALLVLLKEANIPVVKAGIGNINKTDLISAKANLDINELDSIIVGFNSQIDEEVEKLSGNVKIITNDVVYKLIEDVVEYRKQKAQEIEKVRLMDLATITKLEILHQYMFRNSNPAVFGIKVIGGKVRKDLNLIDEAGQKVARVKNLELDKKSVDEANLGQELAISLPGVNFERALKDKKFLYSDISESQFKNFKKNKDILSQDEIKTLQEIAEIKRKDKPEWGM